jgi:hypothetical protein
LRTLVAGSRVELADTLLRPWPWFADLCTRQATYAEPDFRSDARMAAAAWDRSVAQGQPYDLVFSVLEPGNPASGILPDTSRRESLLASGLGLFAWVRSHAGTSARLVAVAQRPETWGAQGVYAALARSILGADVLDTTQRDSLGRPLLIPSWLGLESPRRDCPMSLFEEDLDDLIAAMAMSFDAHARSLVEVFREIDQLRHRGNLSKPISHTPQWLRTLAKVEYEPQLLALVARAARDPALARHERLLALDLAMPTRVGLANSPHSLVKYLARTFDLMADLAAE